MELVSNLLAYLLLMASGQQSAIDDRQVKWVFQSKSDPSVQYVSTSSSETGLMAKTKCAPTDQVVVIIPGWTETIAGTPWIAHLIANLKTVDTRPKCIVVVDNSYYTNGVAYPTAYGYFDALVRHFVARMLNLLANGYEKNNCYVIGNSLGSEIALSAGQILAKTNQQPARIDGKEMQI